MQDKYIILKYLRLSKEDGDKEESDSIAHQRSLIDFYINKEFSDRRVEVIELVDDGYTGTNMNRPGMKKLLILAETHSIDCIIVKDFSRFARDYIEVGRYAEQKFPEWEIRFISVNDNYDSRDYRGVTGGIDVALKNITYTLYSRDLSEKVKSARRIQYKMGKFISPYAFYGYVKDPDNKGHLLIDELAAENIRRMFNMKLSGMTTKQIAMQLNKEKVPTPSEYKKSRDPLCRKWNTVSDYMFWSGNTVGHILADERYTGKLISGKYERAAVGSTKVRRSKERIVVENTHEPIVSQEVFDAVRISMKHKPIKHYPKLGLQSMVKCGGCRHTMSYNRTTGQDVRYACQYRNLTEENDCFCGSILESELSKVVIETIKAEVAKAADMSKVIEKTDINSKRISDDIARLNAKIAQEKRKKTQEYILLTKNRITEEEFTKRREAINDVIARYEQQLTELQYKAVSVDKLSATGIFDKYIGTEEINRDTVQELIKEIYVYTDKRIEIVWNICEK